MAPIDPERLLKCLSPLLDETSGAIKSDREVDKIYGLMIKYCRKLVSKCIYLQILNATKDNVLELFMNRGGWTMLNSWLAEGIDGKNYALVDEILNHFLICEPTLERLKQEQVAKMVKQLSKDATIRQSTQTLARQVYTKWVALVKSPAAQTTNSLGQIPAELSLDEELTSLDLNSLQFNPEDFNSALDVLEDPSVATLVDPTISNELQQQQSTEPPSIELQELNPLVKDLIQPTDQVYTIIVREGKNFLVRADNPTGAMPEPGDMQQNQSERLPEEAIKKRSRKDPTIKKVPGGKPPLRTYSNLSGYSDEFIESQISSMDKPSSSVSTLTASQLVLKKPAEKPKPDEGEAAKSIHSTAASSNVSKKATVASENKNPKDAAGAKRKPKKPSLSALQQMERERELKIKMKEQKRLLKERKKKAEEEALLKAQKARDEETLKSLNLVALGPQNNNKVIPKIPKKPVGFADAIGIPGSSNKEKPVKKLSIDAFKKDLKRQSSTEDKGKTSFTNEGQDERKRVISRPKVKMTTKNRGSTLIDDMTKTGDGVKTRASSQEKEKDSEKPDDSTSKQSPNDKSNSKESSPAKIIKKKRPSSELSTSPATESSKQKKQKLDGSAMEVDETGEEPTTPTTPITPTSSLVKRVGLQESSLFMDALNATTNIVTNRDKKRRRTSSTEVASELVKHPSKSKGGTDSPTKPVFNFYRETLSDETGEEGGNNMDEDGTDELNISLDKPLPSLPSVNVQDGPLKSILHIHRGIKGGHGTSKKSVRWVSDSELKSYFYFEMDETERVNVTRGLINGESAEKPSAPKDFNELQKNEKAQERKMRNLFGVKDVMQESIEWSTPKKVLLTNAIEITISSEEAGVQEEREKRTLEVIYFGKAGVPDNPDESDVSTVTSDVVLPMTMPFDDVVGVTTVKNLEDISKAPPAQDPQLDPSSAMMDSINMISNMGNLAYDPMAMAQMGMWNASNPFAMAMAAAAATPAGPPLDLWGNPAATASLLAVGASAQQQMLYQQQQQQVPQMMDQSFGNGYQSSNFSRNRPERRGGGHNDIGGGGRRQHSRFEPRSGDRPDRRGDAGGRRRFDDSYRAGDKDYRGPRGGGGGRDFRGGNPNNNTNSERKRGQVAKTVLCKFFAIGACKAGKDCDFLHPGINGPLRRHNNASNQPYRNNYVGGQERGSTSSGGITEDSPASPDASSTNDFGTSNSNSAPVTIGGNDENWDE